MVCAQVYALPQTLGVPISVGNPDPSLCTRAHAGALVFSMANASEGGEMLMCYPDIERWGYGRAMS